jgi:hypothetical protein
MLRAIHVLKMSTRRSSTAGVTTDRSKRCNIPEGSHRLIRRRECLRSRQNYNYSPNRTVPSLSSSRFCFSGFRIRRKARCERQFPVTSGNSPSVQDQPYTGQQNTGTHTHTHTHIHASSKTRTHDLILWTITMHASARASLEGFLPQGKHQSEPRNPLRSGSPARRKPTRQWVWHKLHGRVLS